MGNGEIILITLFVAILLIVGIAGFGMLNSIENPVAFTISLTAVFLGLILVIIRSSKK